MTIPKNILFGHTPDCNIDFTFLKEYDTNTGNEIYKIETWDNRKKLLKTYKNEMTETEIKYQPIARRMAVEEVFNHFINDIMENIINN